MIGAGTHTAAYVPDGIAKPAGWAPSVTEQQMIMKELSMGSSDADADVQALSGMCWVGWLLSFDNFFSFHNRISTTDDVLHDHSARL
jgi:hypothetical protein